MAISGTLEISQLFFHKVFSHNIAEGFGMNLKELVVPLILAVLGTFAIQYFFFNKPTPPADGVRTMTSFTAPTDVQECRPLNSEIDFIDSKRPAPSLITTVQTDGANFYFSTDGASLDRLEFKRKSQVKEYTIDTIFPVSDSERENRCFLVAYDFKTPFYYTLQGQQDLADATILTYQAESDDALLTKIFTIYKHTYQVDLEMNITLKKADASIGQLRLFYPSPLMADFAENDLISAVVAGQQGKIQKTARSSVNVNQGWLNPDIFGTDSRYFVHALVKDPQAFCQRAYFKFFNKTRMMSVVEGPEVKQNSSWKVSFYVGPKDEAALIAVDPRLEQTLDYSGLLGPIAKWLLLVLNFLFAYLHSYGWAIVVLTLLIKILLLPLTIKAETSNKKRLEFQKKLEYVKKRYKDDPERSKQEQAELISKHGLPGLAGCLPNLLQMPIFFALNRILSSSFDLYQVPFLWIPDLALKDPLYILPILTTICMLLMMQGTDVRQRLSGIAIAVLFGAFSTTFSAGLTLFIFVSTFLSVVQSFIQKRFA